MRISDWSSDVCSSDLPHRRSRGRFAILDPASAARRAAPVIQDRQEPIMQIISTSAAADNAAFFAAIANAERRALHSYFDQHVVADEEAGYITIDEGDYGALPIDRKSTRLDSRH